MQLYHITSATTEDWREVFRSEGLRKGGRWSSPGTAVLYASSHLTLAARECLVHCDRDALKSPRLALCLEVADEQVEVLDHLPRGWDSIPSGTQTQTIGDAWVGAQKKLALVVPTATLLGGEKLAEHNVLLNPNFPELFSHLECKSVEPFRFDARILALVKGAAA